MARNRDEQPTGTPGISRYQTADGVRYKVVVDVGGSGARVQRSRQGFRTRKEADAWRASQITSRATGKPGATKETVAQFAARWLRHCEAAGVRPGTVYGYDRKLSRHLLPVLGGARLDRVTTAQIQELESSLLAGGLGAGTVRNVHAIVRRLFRQAVAWRVLGESPVEGVRAPKPPPARAKVWTAGEARRFLAATKDEPWGVLWAVLLGTGMRLGEALALTWADVDLRRGVVRIARTVTVDRRGRDAIGDTKSAKGRRTISLGPVAMGALSRIEIGQKSGDHVFASTDGGPGKEDTARKAFYRALRKHKMTRIRCHDLRHIAITLSLASGVPVKAVADRAGHSTIRLTADRYGHASASADAAAAARLGRVLGGAHRQPGRGARVTVRRRARRASPSL